MLGIGQKTKIIKLNIKLQQIRCWEIGTEYVDNITGNFDLLGHE